MANLIDISYFKNGDLYIPNTENINSGEIGSANNSDLEFYIVEYERIYN